MAQEHGGRQPDTKHHGGNQPGEDRPHEKPEKPRSDVRPDVKRPENEPGGKKRQVPGADPDKPGGRY